MSVPPFAYYVLLPALQRIMINHSDVLLTIITVYIDKQQALWNIYVQIWKRINHHEHV